MFFSIIIPVYNVAEYLGQCLESIRCQRFRDYEVILVDDGSGDGSGALCDAFAREDARFRVLHQKNAGAAAARNAGIDRASGSYLLFLDGDDCWSSDTVLTCLAERLERTRPDVLSYNYVKFSGETYEKPYFSCPTQEPEGPKDFSFQSEMELWTACPWNKAIRSDLFQNGALRFFEGITAEDMDWSLRLALEARSFDYLSDALVHYRQRGSSVSNAISAGKVRVILDNVRRCIALLEENGTQRAEQLKPFVAYQYGTALYHLAKLPKSGEAEALTARAGELRYLLRWSRNRKIRLLHMAAALGGLKFTLALLRLKK